MLAIKSRAFILCTLAAVVLPGIAQSRYMPPATACTLEPGEGSPFTAQFVLISVQLLASGDIYTHRSAEIQALDSHGRSYESTEFPITSPKPIAYAPLVSGRVCDPVNNTQTLWDTHDRRTVILKMPEPAERRGCWQSDDGQFRINFGLGRPSETRGIQSDESRSNGPSLQVEELGTSVFQGVEAVGYRSTWPAPSNGAPDPPYLMEEHWIAPSLGIWVSQEVDYPRKLNQTLKWSRELANLEATEPDALLFEPPQNYTIKKENMREVPCGRRPALPPIVPPRLH